jgi:exopolyphosphatase / guanosine-5'-triphosphate,3'-diphosphate pyrophosphatase
MTLATIDIGTNTTLLLVASVTGSGAVEVLEERAEITRLGRGIGAGGALGGEAIARTLAALTEFAAAARRHGARIFAVGTEALRRAPNASEFLEPAADVLGTAVEVIDGSREAALTFGAVLAAFPDARVGNVVVVDIGGGSTEIVIAHGGAVGFRTSLPLGSVRLTERFVRHDPAGEDEISAVVGTVDAALAGVPFPAGAAQLVGVAGTVTSLAAMAQGLASYDATRVHGYRLPADALALEIDRLRGATQQERERIPGLDPRRADVILAGALILDRIARAARVSEIRVSDRGIRWGLLHEVCSTRT